MSKRKPRQENSTIKRVTRVGTVSLLSLLLLFLIVTIFSTSRLASQIKLLTEHPFTVNGDISDVKTGLALMRIRTERLQSYNQPEDVEMVRRALKDLYAEMKQLLDEIDELYLGPDEDVDALRKTYVEIQEAHQLFLEFAKQPGSTTDQIAEYEEVNLYPLYNTFEENAAKILTFVQIGRAHV